MIFIWGKIQKGFRGVSHCYFTAQLLFLSNRPKRNEGMQEWTRDGRVNGKKDKET